jgi:ankyrin repeat protein
MTSALLLDFADAIQFGDNVTVQSLLDDGSVDANTRLPLRGRPPALLHAAAFKRLAIVEILLRANARVDDADDDGITPCHMAALRGGEDVVALLLAHKPDLSLESANKLTSLQFSFTVARNELVSAMLIVAGAPLGGVDHIELCFVAAMSAPAAQAMFERGVAVSELRDYSGYSALCRAAMAPKCDPALLHVLLNVCGIDVDFATARGETAIHVAATWCNADTLRFFIAAGANVDCVNFLGCTPLQLTRDYECLIVLLAAGANVHSRNLSGVATIDRAVLEWMSTTMDNVHALIAAGVDIDDPAVRSGLILTRIRSSVDPDEVDAARQRIARERLDFVRNRALQICVGLGSRDLDALQMCEILQHGTGPVAPLIAFHIWWKIATTVKHFCRSRNE